MIWIWQVISGEERREEKDGGGDEEDGTGNGKGCGREEEGRE